MIEVKTPLCAFTTACLSNLCPTSPGGNSDGKASYSLQHLGLPPRNFSRQSNSSTPSLATAVRLQTLTNCGVYYEALYSATYYGKTSIQTKIKSITSLTKSRILGKSSTVVEGHKDKRESTWKYSVPLTNCVSSCADIPLSNLVAINSLTVFKCIS